MLTCPYCRSTRGTWQRLLVSRRCRCAACGQEALLRYRSWPAAVFAAVSTVLLLGGYFVAVVWGGVYLMDRYGLAPADGFICVALVLFLGVSSAFWHVRILRRRLCRLMAPGDTAAAAHRVCPVCHEPPPADAIDFGTVRVCPGCKQTWVQRLREGVGHF